MSEDKFIMPDPKEIQIYENPDNIIKDCEDCEDCIELNHLCEKCSSSTSWIDSLFKDRMEELQIYNLHKKVYNE